RPGRGHRGPQFPRCPIAVGQHHQCPTQRHPFRGRRRPTGRRRVHLGPDPQRPVRDGVGRGGLSDRRL
ncbi:MAG: hypothetical protein AVDCRST_MAG70-1317, partial [uncultured Thermomicrobiales bacterium]